MKKFLFFCLIIPFCVFANTNIFEYEDPDDPANDCLNGNELGCIAYTRLYFTDKISIFLTQIPYDISQLENGMKKIEDVIVEGTFSSYEALLGEAIAKYGDKKPLIEAMKGIVDFINYGPVSAVHTFGLACSDTLNNKSEAYIQPISTCKLFVNNADQFDISKDLRKEVYSKVCSSELIFDSSIKDKACKLK